MQLRELLTTTMVVVALASGGCGDGLPPTASVSGQLLSGGEPVTDAVILFQPDSGRPATGRTNQAGEFTLGTFAAEDGAIAGEHVVVITQYSEEAPPMEQPFANAGLVDDNAPIPNRYQSVTSTPLRATVSLDEPNRFQFELTP